MNKWFALPRMGKETFSDLMRAKVKYDTKFGFMFTSSTNVERALAILSSALSDQVVMTSACFICNNPLDTVDDSEIGSPSTLCSNCQRNSEALDLYKLKFVKLMESV